MTGTNDLTQSQEDWLTAITGKAVEDAKKSRAASAARSEGVNLVEQRLQGSREKIREGQTYTIEKMPKNAVTALAAKIGLVSKIKSLDPKADPIKEIDSWHDLPGSKGMKPEEVREVMESMKIIVEIQEDLKNLKDSEGRHVYQPDPTLEEIEEENHKKFEETKKITDPEARQKAQDKLLIDYRAAVKAHDDAMPDFERRLSEDLWQPMMREGLIPENAIPDQYSEVSRTFSEASDLYQERLQDYSKDLDGPKKVLAVLKPVCNVSEGLLKSAAAFTMVGAAGTAISDNVTSISKSGNAREIAEQVKTLNLVTLCVSSFRVGAEKAIEQRDAYGVADAFNSALVGVLTATVGKDTAKLVGAIITSSTRGVKVIDKLKDGKFDEAIEALGDSIGAGMSTSGDDSVKKAGKYIQAAFKTIAKSIKGMKNKSPQEVLAAALTMATKAAEVEGARVTEALHEKTIEKIKADTTISEEERAARIEWAKGNKPTPKGTGDMETGILSAGALKSLDAMASEAIDKEALAKLEEDASKKLAQDFEDFMMTPDDDFEELLINGFSVPQTEAEQEALDMEKQLNSIEHVIALHKRNEQIFELSRKIAEGGTSFLASLVPATGVVAVATQMMFTLGEAIKHTRQLVIWTENLKDAKNAKSAQFDAMLNRRGLQLSQTIQADIKFGLQAIALLGKILETAAAVSGTGAPIGLVGTAMSAGAQGTQALMEVAVTVKTEIEMAKAWSMYKKALAEPRDRKNVRQALRQNPTLAKYAIAYGAVVDKNPIAQKALGRCGLNAKTLADPSSNTKKVVEYLEMVYKEDPVLLRAVPVKQEWYPGSVELTLKGWNRFFLMGTTKAKPEVDSRQDVSKINITVTALEEALNACEKMLDDDFVADEKSDPKLVIAVSDACKQLILALARYEPKDKDGEAHEEMAEYKDALSAMAEIKQGRALAVEEEIAKAVKLAA